MSRSWNTSMAHSPSKKEVMTDPLLRKGHRHPMRQIEPEVCPDCKGRGYLANEEECSRCGGTGEIYE